MSMTFTILESAMCTEGDGEGDDDYNTSKVIYSILKERE